MQITEALISEPGDIRRFVQQAVDHWPHLLAFYFTLHSAEGNINGQQIHAFCTSFYRQVHERITERNHTGQSILAGGITLVAGTTWRSNNTMPVAAQPDEHLPSAGQCHG
ncbi:hypothetical protein RX21_03424 [Escherichia coli]|nr:hypothetical protein RX21_03424 [Escherichia coli]